jgi:hypothetical protein
MIVDRRDELVRPVPVPIANREVTALRRRLLPLRRPFVLRSRSLAIVVLDPEQHASVSRPREAPDAECTRHMPEV